MLTPDGMQHVLFREGARSLQLTVSGASILEPVHLLVDAVSPLPEGRWQRSLLACLDDLHHHGRLRMRYFPPHPRRHRLMFVLRALDGWLAGASYREIAIALFGAQRVAADWTDPRRYMLDGVRRAVSRGRQLMTGGYRQLLL